MKSNDPYKKNDKGCEQVSVSTKKDSKKQRRDSDDKKEKEKRRDSVTGSPLDTSSSSNSSLESDEVDITEQRESKDASSCVEPKSQEKIRLDDSILEVIKNISTLVNMEKSERSKSAAELNETVNEKVDACSGSKTEIDSSNTKKYRKRNRKQKKKDLEDTNVVINSGSKSCLISAYKLFRTTKKPEVIDIDGIEASNLLDMKDMSQKFAQRFPPWIQSFYLAAIEGKVEDFVKKFLLVIQILKKSSSCELYRQMSSQQLKEHVMNNIMCVFFNESESISVLHYLAPTINIDRPCRMQNHGYCRLIRVILSTLSWKNRKALLFASTKRTGKTALHLAAATGQCCQLLALMDFGGWADVFDSSGRAPLHYAIMRNNLEMVKNLLWYGADISLRERSSTPLQLAGCSPFTMTVCEYLHARGSALQKIFMQWVTKYVRGVWTPEFAISDLHFVKLTKACDAEKDAHEGITAKYRQVCIDILDTRANNPKLKKYPLMLLFIVPTFYKRDDRTTDASNPQIFCAKLEDESKTIVRLLPIRPLLSCSKWRMSIKSAFERPHNGFFYVYNLPQNIEIDSYTLHFLVDLEQLRSDAPYITLGIQAFACGPPTLAHYNDLRGLPTHSVNKTKVD
ncbi:unnamed protein product [Thelazia callipaeda]|uniref:ANK_REP_REGION domain-containing protein n=1 Tax=Thelazia callipaeda TaxID=103827 RepID=A0A0N5D5S9_THECL|nr:unnamed protein product [Thelazia callipaeda]